MASTDDSIDEAYVIVDEFLEESGSKKNQTEEKELIKRNKELEERVASLLEEKSKLEEKLTICMQQESTMELKVQKYQEELAEKNKRHAELWVAAEREKKEKEAALESIKDATSHFKSQIQNYAQQIDMLKSESLALRMTLEEAEPTTKNAQVEEMQREINSLSMKCVEYKNQAKEASQAYQELIDLNQIQHRRLAELEQLLMSLGMH